MIKIIKGLDPADFVQKKIENELDVFTMITIDNFTIEHGKFKDFLLRNQDSIFLNIICSGYGGTSFEPYCPEYVEIKRAVQELLKEGFSASNIMISLSPVIRNSKGILRAEEVLKSFRESGVYKIHLSKMYQTAIQRTRMLKRFGVVIKEDVESYKLEVLMENFQEYNFYTCASESVECKGCIPVNLNYQLYGCRGAIRGNKDCQSLAADIHIIKDLSENLFYLR